ncbi:MAG: helix-turn-helix domain-containing protein [Polyangiaceae bacterium]|jgi:AcrR family transcriptional regulator
MSRPITISDDTILEAARALFTEKGPRATTAEIAARAGVSEGILFKRFGSKAGLHKAAMSSRDVTGWIRRETRAQGPLRTEADFARFIRWQANVLRDVVPLVMVAWSSRSRADELPADLTGSKPAPLTSILTLAEMLQEQMETGHLAPRNAEAVARILIGSIWYFVFMQVVFSKARGGIDEQSFAGELARVVFRDVDPGRGSRGRRKAGR